jgi:hypothetical protein
MRRRQTLCHMNCASSSGNFGRSLTVFFQVSQAQKTLQGEGDFGLHVGEFF